MKSLLFALFLLLPLAALTAQDKEKKPGVLPAKEAKSKVGEAITVEAMDRHEVVMVMGEGIGDQRTRILKIVRTDAGGFFGLTELEGLPADQFQGRFVDLLSPKPLTPEVVEIARVMLAMKGLNEQKLRGGGRRR